MNIKLAMSQYTADCVLELSLGFVSPCLIVTPITNLLHVVFG